MDATAVVSTALTIDLNNFIKGALNGLSDADLTKRPVINAIPLAGHCGTPRAWKTGLLPISVASHRCGLKGAGTRSLTCRPIPARVALVIP